MYTVHFSSNFLISDLSLALFPCLCLFPFIFFGLKERVISSFSLILSLHPSFTYMFLSSYLSSSFPITVFFVFSLFFLFKFLPLSHLINMFLSSSFKVICLFFSVFLDFFPFLFVFFLFFISFTLFVSLRASFYFESLLE